MSDQARHGPCRRTDPLGPVFVLLLGLAGAADLAALHHDEFIAPAVLVNVVVFCCCTMLDATKRAARP